MKYVGIVLILVSLVFAVPTVHKADLTWTQSTSTGVTGDCVYRSQVSGGPYTQINCSTSPTTTYTDTTVQGGQTYFYVVTAVAGIEESAYSNEVQAVIPQAPAPDGGLSVTTQ